MANGTKETKEQSEVKKPQAKSETKSSCGCGCIPPMKTKQANLCSGEAGCLKTICFPI